MLRDSCSPPFARSLGIEFRTTSTALEQLITTGEPKPDLSVDPNGRSIRYGLGFAEQCMPFARLADDHARLSG
jgi:hypothetical protein